MRSDFERDSESSGDALSRRELLIGSAAAAVPLLRGEHFRNAAGRVRATGRDFVSETFCGLNCRASRADGIVVAVSVIISACA